MPRGRPAWSARGTPTSRRPSGCLFGEVGIESLAGPSELVVRRRRDRARRADRLGPAARSSSTGRARSRSWSQTDAEVLDAVAGCCRRTAGAVLIEADVDGHGVRLRERLRARARPARVGRRRGWRSTGCTTPARSSSARTPAPRSATTSPARTTSCPPAGTAGSRRGSAPAAFLRTQEVVEMTRGGVRAPGRRGGRAGRGRGPARTRPVGRGAGRQALTDARPGRSAMSTRRVIVADGAPKPFAGAPYNQAIKAAGLVFCAGQVGLDPVAGTLVAGRRRGAGPARAAEPVGGARGGRLERSTAWSRPPSSSPTWATSRTVNEVYATVLPERSAGPLDRAGGGAPRGRRASRSRRSPSSSRDGAAGGRP